MIAAVKRSYNEHLSKSVSATIRGVLKVPH